MAKLTEEFATHLDDDLAVEFRRRAVMAGCKPAELLRDLIVDMLHGVTYGEYVAQSRRQAIARPAASVPDRGGR
jgi:hypothetical protein